MAHAYFSIGGYNETVLVDTAVLVFDDPGVGVLLSFISSPDRVDFSIYPDSEIRDTLEIQSILINGSNDKWPGTKFGKNERLKLSMLMDKSTLDQLKSFIDSTGCSYFSISDYLWLEMFSAYIDPIGLNYSMVSSDQYSVSLELEVQ